MKELLEMCLRKQKTRVMEKVVEVYVSLFELCLNAIKYQTLDR